VQATPPCQADLGDCPFTHAMSESCNEAQEMWLTSIDTGIGAAYDTVTGKLVAILWNGDGAITCAAGPACVARSGCTRNWITQCCPVDAGAE
jgi:hypothetical protein